MQLVGVRRGEARREDRDLNSRDPGTEYDRVKGKSPKRIQGVCREHVQLLLRDVFLFVVFIETRKQQMATIFPSYLNINLKKL